MGASMSPSILLPIKKPTMFERKHPKVTPQMPMGEKRGRSVSASLIRTWTMPADVPKARGPLIRVRMV